MATYQVIWEIDIEADTPQEAAKYARECQHLDTEALEFNVIDNKTKEETNVDLLTFR